MLGAPGPKKLTILRVRETSHCNNDRDFTMHNSALRMLIILDEYTRPTALSPHQNSPNYMIWSFGQMAFSLQNDNVELAVTESGGHMAPVTFTVDGRRQIQPFSIAPWWKKKLPKHLFFRSYRSAYGDPRDAA